MKETMQYKRISLTTLESISEVCFRLALAYSF